MMLLAKDGSQQTLRFMEPGDIIGCAAVFRRIPYPATAIAVADSVILSWNAKVLDGLMRDEPRLVQNALAIVGGRANDILQRLREATTANATQRIARALITLARQTSGCEAPVEIRLSRQDLAELTDSSLYTVSRTLAAWTRAGILARGRERVIISDIGKLAAIAKA